MPEKAKTVNKNFMKRGFHFAASSLAVLKHVQNMRSVDFEDKFPDVLEPEQFRAKMSIEPMLLALSMEYILKAWICWDNRRSGKIVGHDLYKLFMMISAERREILNHKFRTTIDCRNQFIFVGNPSIENALYGSRNAFIDWRYLHETTQATSFSSSEFEQTIEMLISEFVSRFSIRKLNPLFSQVNKI